MILIIIKSGTLFQIRLQVMDLKNQVGTLVCLSCLWSDRSRRVLISGVNRGVKCVSLNKHSRERWLSENPSCREDWTLSANSSVWCLCRPLPRRWSYRGRETWWPLVEMTTLTLAHYLLSRLSTLIPELSLSHLFTIYRFGWACNSTGGGSF